MTITGVYFILESPTTSVFQTLVAHLTATYQPTPLPRWSLEHRLMRETAPSSSNATSTTAGEEGKTAAATVAQQPKYLQYLHLSHHPGKSYVCIKAPQDGTAAAAVGLAGSPKEGGGGDNNDNNKRPAPTLITIPHTPPPSSSSSSSSSSAAAESGPNPSDELLQLLSSRLAPLWTHRQTLVVGGGQGVGYEMEDFRVRVGEVRQGGVQSARGVLVEIEWVGGGGGGGGMDGYDGDREDEDGQENGDEDWETGEAVIKAFWQGLGIKEGREAIRVPGVEGRDGMDVARQFFEVLRLRG
ncbi:MAG: hypothetical protein M1827_002619 [Pycnora praestabilis]|nr:MAG: hypothetical protein M1827_002619 [Pycnora praestabilis]